MKLNTHLRAVLLALFVTFLWSSSFVFIKIGLEDIPAITFAGYRYFLAALVLMPFVVFRAENRAVVRSLTQRDWGMLLALGVIYYTMTQGTQFIALDLLPSTTVSMFLNLTTLVVAALGMIFLREYLNGLQWFGVVLSLIGAFVYLYPVNFPEGQIVGVIAVLVGMTANGVASVIGRYVNRGGALPPVVVTTISMTIGGSIMLAVALTLEGWVSLSLQSWLIILLLAVVNTALAFTLWNRALQDLPAAEATIINNTMLIQIGILAWVFLGESLDVKAVIGLAMALVGTLIVQLKSSATTTEAS